jgi:hypothetical protein
MAAYENQGTSRSMGARPFITLCEMHLGMYCGWDSRFPMTLPIFVAIDPCIIQVEMFGLCESCGDRPGAGRDAFGQ